MRKRIEVCWSERGRLRRLTPWLFSTFLKWLQYTANQSTFSSRETVANAPWAVKGNSRSTSRGVSALRQHLNRSGASFDLTNNCRSLDTTLA
jgi:hypothetical protein